MSENEKRESQYDSIKNIDGFVQSIKRWWPLLTLFCVVIGATATVVASFFRYDNSNHASYAEKKDVIELMGAVQQLSIKVDNLSAATRDYRYKDSINADEIKKTVVLNKFNADKQLAYIRSKCIAISYVTEQWVKGKLVQHPTNNYGLK